MSSQPAAILSADQKVVDPSADRVNLTAGMGWLP